MLREAPRSACSISRKASTSRVRAGAGFFFTGPSSQAVGDRDFDREQARRLVLARRRAWRARWRRRRAGWRSISGSLADGDRASSAASARRRPAAAACSACRDAAGGEIAARRPAPLRADAVAPAGSGAGRAQELEHQVAAQRCARRIVLLHHIVPAIELADRQAARDCRRRQRRSGAAADRAR